MHGDRISSGNACCRGRRYGDSAGKRRAAGVAVKRTVAATMRFTAEDAQHRRYRSETGSIGAIGRSSQARIGLSGDARANAVIPRDGRGADHSQRRRRRNGGCCQQYMRRR